MKAVSVKQPWASLIAEGNKTIETRTWPTNYRGDLLICASKKPKIEDLPVSAALCVAKIKIGVMNILKREVVVFAGTIGIAFLIPVFVSMLVLMSSALFKLH